MCKENKSKQEEQHSQLIKFNNWVYGRGEWKWAIDQLVRVIAQHVQENKSNQNFHTNENFDEYQHHNQEE